MNFYVVFGVLATLALHALAEEAKDGSSSTATAAIDRAASVAKPNPVHDKHEWSLIPNNYGAALATGGVVVAGVVVLLAIAAVISPLFGYKLCQVFSTCDLPSSAGPGYASDNSFASGFASSPFASNYKKRSIEYVGPILQALNSAYEKYGHGAGPLSFQNLNKINAQ